MQHSLRSRRVEWRASLKYGRTIYDADYTLESGYFKLNVVYIESGE